MCTGFFSPYQTHPVQVSTFGTSFGFTVFSLSLFSNLYFRLWAKITEKLVRLRITRAPSCLRNKSFPCWAASSQPASATPTAVQPSRALCAWMQHAPSRLRYSSWPVPLPVVPLLSGLSPAGKGCPAKPGSNVTAAPSAS